MKLLSIDTNAKTVKGQKKGYITGICYLAPANEAGRGNICPFASEGCKAACLYTAGRGKFNNVQQARINRVNAYFDNNKSWFEQLCKEIEALRRKAERESLIPCIRLNGTSDLSFEFKKFEYRGKRQTVFDHFSDIQFYDYTKNVKRATSEKLPSNYHLTFSRSESNEREVLEVIKNTKINIAVVFKDSLPAKYLGRKVINADETDLRFTDPENVICGLIAKGDGKKDGSGFVVS